ncbi:MAG: hypothetical protein AMJ54_11720 [Deltaproteobacteria bacterium SG8_13]|nr:MAG: hypothetical protein AMJ54_11720 [Deltaproteobacteria bacterium SG8_13]
MKAARLNRRNSGERIKASNQPQERPGGRCTGCFDSRPAVAAAHGALQGSPCPLQAEIARH